MAKKEKSTHLIHRFKAQDRSGQWAQYFVLMDAANEPFFIDAVRNGGDVDLSQFGKIVASFYGDTPPENVKKLLLEQYGFKV
jgi:hypothetical protein